MSRIKLKALAFGVGIVGLMAGVGYAAIPSADGTISACKSNKGALKVIDAEAGQACPDGQQLLTWNQQGQPGVSGYEVVELDGEAGQTGHRGIQLLCPAGKKVLGGGGVSLTEAGSPWPLPQPYVDKPLVGGVGWDFRAWWQDPGIAWKVRGYAICANVR